MSDDDGLIAAIYRIDASRPGPGLAGGFRTFMVTDRRSPSQGLVAIETRAELPGRARITLARNGPPVPHTVLPIEYGVGRDTTGKPGWYIVCDPWPGTPLWATRQPWRESDLIAHVLLPAAACLAALNERGLTHRAINPENLFRAGPRDAITLGPFWAAPPASLQPPVCEPPYMARCLPCGRGDGTIADDVYALGVTLLALAAGHMPLADRDEAAILRAKMELGSYAALTAGIALPPLLSDLLRGMLAEDPDHRPSPALLLKPEQARARRVAARPPRRAQQPLALGGAAIWSARELALGLGANPERSYAALRSGEVERWLRRCLGDPQLGMRIEEITRRADDYGADDARGQNVTVLQSAAILDPLSPLVWRGLAVQPDGLGSAFAGASPEITTALCEIVASEAVGHYASANDNPPELAILRDEQRDWRGWLTAKGPAGGLKRLGYGVNPMLPCASPLLAGQMAVRAADLLPALNAAAAGTDRTKPPIDTHVAAFIAARVDSAIALELIQLTSFAGADDRLAVLRLYGRLQERLNPGPLPGLAGWLISSGFVAMEDWRSRKTRVSLEKVVAKAAEEGNISTIVDLLDNQAARHDDREGATRASDRAVQLEQALAQSAENAPNRAQAAQRLGHEIAAGGALMATLCAALALAIS